MRNSLPARWRAPAILGVAAVAAVLVGGATHGWGTVPYVLPIPIAVLVFLSVMARTDTDYGASLRFQYDERQAEQRYRIQALVGRVLSVAVAVAYLVALAVGATIWPYAVLVGLMAVTFVAGRFRYDEHGSGDED
jgi:hypothetical protein